MFLSDFRSHVLTLVRSVRIACSFFAVYQHKYTIVVIHLIVKSDWPHNNSKLINTSYIRAEDEIQSGSRQDQLPDKPY